MDWSKCASVTDASGSHYQVATLSCLPVLFFNVLNALFIFSGAIAIVIIIISGYRFIFSGGQEKQLETAQKTFTYAIAGLILILLSTLIINIIATVTGISCINIGNFGLFNGSACSK